MQEQASAETAGKQDAGTEMQASVAPTAPAKPEEPQVQLLDLNKIVNSDYNPRKDFREETLLELSESIRQSGVLQPICVRPRTRVSRSSTASDATGRPRWRG